MKKRLFGVFLTVCMVLTMLPAAALADTPAQAQWGVAGSNGSVPAESEWVNSGTLTYANSLNGGTAYIQLQSKVDTAAPFVFKAAILDLNGWDIDRELTEAAVTDGYVIAVQGTLTLKDSRTDDVTSQGRITGGYNSNGTSARIN